MNSLLRTVGVLAATTSFVQAATYSLADNFVGSGFYSGFTWEAIADPTHGRVNYIDQATAKNLNLSYASGNSFIMKADSTNVLSASGPGRNAMRIKSVKTYTTSVLVADIHHMPEGCGTWPALWTVDEAAWPNEGEIDIVEGVNNVSPNQMTLHTSPGCTMPASTSQTGTTVSTDCNTADNGNQGCGVHTPGANTFGPGFNANGGGWYAMERNPNSIRVWFWPRNGNPPAGISNPGSNVNTDNWGTPAANFPSTNCNLNSHFGAHNIIINLTFCGDWAGAVYGSDSCPGTCVDTVNNNPGSFANAYWNIGSIRTYE